MKVAIALFFAALLVVCSSPAESAGAAQCGKGVCNEIDFTINVPDFNLMNFHYHAISWLSEDGKKGCHVMIDMDQPALFYGASVIGFTADLADGAKVGVGLQYARVEILCSKGRISYKDVTRKS